MSLMVELKRGGLLSLGSFFLLGKGIMGRNGRPWSRSQIRKAIQAELEVAPPRARPVIPRSCFSERSHGEVSKVSNLS